MEYHKSLKQNASMGKSPIETLTTQATYSFAAVLAHTKLEVFKLKCVVSGIFVSKPNWPLSA